MLTIAGEDETFINKVAEAAKYHDSGKALIPEEILYKAGKLTHDEFEIVKGHTKMSVNVLETVSGEMSADIFLLALDIAQHHHERVDGKGYPEGLKGNQISLPAQVAGLADVVDALLSKRCYKPAFEFDCAINMIKNNECGKFSDKMLNLLEKAIPQLKSMYCVA